ncbi:hypothetical protein A3C96_01210 [Candidatus Uhrbacteria bacterium RIFCSPHIGHO2_02_FULL_60_10]|uniref:Uncharacterized protein n=1 Tax=Candidatus Uhrbacteria bacterium RIFCSPHIGHO2_02_FULL_60_10 TaxID=1802392 RepID=A0A1F7U2P1_9BACT|nr:MAG: hypothetical protein A3C96_01210 [Candidatus Uhrbacteria bacterium RIFCSPHIGHO2_02_FULL_60_10]
MGAVEGSSAEKGAIELPNPFGSSDPRRVLGMFIQLFIGVSGTAALGAFIYGGYTWMTSEGDKMKVEKGKNIFKWATIGLFLIFMAYALVNQLLTFLGVQ